MYQIKVKWCSTSDFKGYEFHTQAELQAFQLALRDAVFFHKIVIEQKIAKDTPHIGISIAATLLVCLWSVIWWNLGSWMFPSADLSYSNIQIAVCSGLAYIVAKIISSWFDL